MLSRCRNTNAMVSWLLVLHVYLLLQLTLPSMSLTRVLSVPCSPLALHVCFIPVHPA